MNNTYKKKMLRSINIITIVITLIVLNPSIANSRNDSVPAKRIRGRSSNIEENERHLLSSREQNYYEIYENKLEVGSDRATSNKGFPAPSPRSKSRQYFTGVKDEESKRNDANMMKKNKSKEQISKGKSDYNSYRSNVSKSEKSKSPSTGYNSRERKSKGSGKGSSSQKAKGSVKSSAKSSSKSNGTSSSKSNKTKGYKKMKKKKTNPPTCVQKSKSNDRSNSLKSKGGKGGKSSKSASKRGKGSKGGKGKDTRESKSYSHSNRSFKSKGGKGYNVGRSLSEDSKSRTKASKGSSEYTSSMKSSKAPNMLRSSSKRSNGVSMKSTKAPSMLRSSSKRSKHKKSSHSRSRTQAPSRCDDNTPDESAVWTVEIKVDYLCGEGPHGTLSSNQKTKLEESIIEFLDETNNIVTVTSSNIVDFSQSDCCVFPGACENPGVSCKATSRSEQSVVTFVIPGTCEGECPEDLLRQEDQNGEPPSSISYWTEFVVENGIDTVKSAVIVKQTMTMADQCIVGNSQCNNEPTCCGVTDGCSCGPVSKSLCDLSCEIGGGGCCDVETSLCMFTDYCQNPLSNLREPRIKKIISEVSLGSDLGDPSSPQSRALNWLINEDPANLSPNDEGLRQRYSLGVFFYSLEQFDSGVFNNWLSDTIICEWDHITCDNAKSVTQLTIEDSGLQGTIPFELQELTDLRVLKIFNSTLQGTIPLEIGMLTNLAVINLSSSNLSGSVPSSIGNLAKLDTLAIFDAPLTGTIPTDVWCLANMTKLDLYATEIAGTIAPDISNLSNLRFLDVSRNALTGDIPPTIALLSHLQFLHMENNRLSGTLPTELGLLGDLTEMELYNNTITGTIPTEFGLLENLTRIRLDRNLISGTIPPEMGELKNLENFQLDNNTLTGIMPEEVCNNGIPILSADCEEVDCPCCTFCLKGRVAHNEEMESYRDIAV